MRVPTPHTRVHEFVFFIRQSMLRHGDICTERATAAGCLQSVNGVRTIRSSPSGDRRSRRGRRGQRSGKCARTLRAMQTRKPGTHGILN